MPRVKIDYVVSFSSESPEAPASNLLASEAGKGRWLCARGEPSCSVMLQLPRAVQISSITIGAHLAALVEVLVGRSETPNDPFQVLVASSVFFSPIDSRRVTEGDSAADRVRSFSGDQLAADVRSKRWDRVRVVCSQPYNKHCKYGLSFIHIFSPEGEADDHNTTMTAAPSTVKDTSTTGKPVLNLPLDVSPQDSDDDEFKPGALFAQHRASQSQSQSQESTTSNTDAQIRKATSQSIKNLFSPSTKIVRTPISKPKGDVTAGDQSGSDRKRDSLMYEEDDAGPHDKIDRLVAAHKEQQAKTNVDKASKEKEKASKKKADLDSSKQKKERSRDESSTDSRTHKDKYKDKDNTDSGSRTKQKDRHRTDDRSKSPQAKRDRSTSSKRDKDEYRDTKKRKDPKEQDTGKTLYAGPVSSEPHTLLRDVVFVLSGYENPRRAGVRDKALAMGASFQRDWHDGCTHLICAFPNTPKLRTVRASANGDSAIVVTAEWIERQAERCRRLPWQWFATEPQLRVKRQRAASGEDPPGFKDSTDTKETGEGPKASSSKGIDRPESECDTDDEIEKVMRKNAQKRARTPSVEEESPSKRRKSDKELANLSQTSSSSDVAFVRDERIQGNVTISDSDGEPTDKEETIEGTQELSAPEVLPSFFEGCTFAVHSANKPVLDEKLVRRYVRAYGGEIVEALDDEDDIEVDYVLCLSSNKDGIRAKGRAVRGDWVWKCHERRRLCSPEEFAL